MTAKGKIKTDKIKQVEWIRTNRYGSFEEPEGIGGLDILEKKITRSL